LLLEEIKDLLNIEEGKTTADGLFHLDVVRCLGCCGLSPVIMIDDKVYGKVNKAQIAEILAKHGKEE